MARVAIYAQEEPGRGDVARLDHQVHRLAVQVGRRPGWWPVATYADRWPSARIDRPGLARLLADAGFGAFDLVVVDGLARLAPDRSTREALLSRLASVGMGVVDLRPSGARRFAAVVADLVGEVAH
jgi:DNA invertase Pin-like site-specific DNA recombinase